jgi:hypothetical protein
LFFAKRLFFLLKPVIQPTEFTQSFKKKFEGYFNFITTKTGKSIRLSISLIKSFYILVLYQPVVIYVQSEVNILPSTLLKFSRKWGEQNFNATRNGL